MRVRPVVRAPAAVLATAGARSTRSTRTIVRLAADLVATMRVSPGCVGLAAPQVGVGAQVFAVDVTGHPKARTVPRRVRAVQRRGSSRPRSGEGPGGLHVGARPHRRREAGRPDRRRRPAARHRRRGRASTTDAFEARALQHEIDHCAGLLFLDRVAGAHASTPARSISERSRRVGAPPGASLPVPVDTVRRIMRADGWPASRRRLLAAAGRRAGAALLHRGALPVDAVLAGRKSAEADRPVLGAVAVRRRDRRRADPDADARQTPTTGDPATSATHHVRRPPPPGRHASTLHGLRRRRPAAWRGA